MQKEINELKCQLRKDNDKMVEQRQLRKNNDKMVEQKVSYTLIFISPFLNIIIMIIMMEFNYNYRNNYQRLKLNHH